MSEYFPGPHPIQANLKVKLNLSSNVKKKKQICKMKQVLIHHLLLKNLIWLV